MFEADTWDELSRPARWADALRPAMEELENTLPGKMGAGIWLHRNVSWSDLERVGSPGVHPSAGYGWPLPYLVCSYRKALFGVLLDTVQMQGLEGKTMECFPGAVPYAGTRETGLPCFCYVLDPENPNAAKQAVQDICKQAAKAVRGKTPSWKCGSSPVHPEREAEGKALLRRGLAEERNGELIPTRRGEDFGLMTLFLPGPGGTVKRSIRWSPSTKRALTGGKEPDFIPLQARAARIGQGLACRDSYAAREVLRLAEMPLEEYFRQCPDVRASDLRLLREILGLQSGCRFRTAAAALYRRMGQAEKKPETELFNNIAGFLAFPAAQFDESEKESILTNFRKGRPSV